MTIKLDIFVDHNYVSPVECIFKVSKFHLKNNNYADCRRALTFARVATRSVGLHVERRKKQTKKEKKKELQNFRRMERKRERDRTCSLRCKWSLAKKIPRVLIMELCDRTNPFCLSPSFKFFRFWRNIFSNFPQVKWSETFSNSRV